MSRITTHSLNITATYAQTLRDATNANNSVTDGGSLTYQRSYATGTGVSGATTSGVVGEIFHVLSGLSSGATHNFNLQSLNQPLLGYSVTKTFSGIQSITLKNHSTVTGASISLLVNSASGFKEPFGAPQSGIIVGPMSSLHANRVVSPYIVGTGSRYIGISGMGSGVTYELVIAGY